MGNESPRFVVLLSVSVRVDHKKPVRGGIMLKLRFAVCAVGAGLAVLGTAPASSQDYPTKPVRVITSPAGGGNDFVARLIARALSGQLGQQVVVDNRPTVLLADITAKAPPDGYTILVTG